MSNLLAESGNETPPSQLPLGVAGTIQKVEMKTASNKKEYALVEFKGRLVACWIPELFPWLKGAKGDTAVLYLEQSGKYTNIVGAVYIGDTSFAEDGKTPVIDRTKL